MDRQCAVSPILAHNTPKSSRDGTDKASVILLSFDSATLSFLPSSRFLLLLQVLQRLEDGFAVTVSDPFEMRLYRELAFSQ